MKLEDNTNCDKPEIKERHHGKCPEDQVRKCHGQEMVDKLKKENKL